MRLNEIGKIAHQFWLEIPNHFPFVESGNFVVMPNHTHGIVIINKTNDLIESSSTTQTSIKKPNNGGKNDQWNPGNIGLIINQFKRIVTIHSRKIEPNFAWQSRFHDHIIRNSISFENIQKYIEENPIKWNRDKFYFKE